MPKRPVSFDVECYPNYFLIDFEDIISGKHKYFEMFGDDEHLDTTKLREFVMKKSYTFFGFNSRNYDMTMLAAALAGFSCSKLKEISDSLIVDELKPWIVTRQFGFKQVYIDHVDLMEVAIGKSSLKMYGARLHAKKLQDLPYDPDETLTREQAVNVRDYCHNDLNVTTILREALIKDLEVREQMTNQYHVDLRSKSDAQIAEAIFKHELEELGINCERPKIKPGTIFHYQIPEQFEFAFQTEEMQQVLEDVRNAEFEVSEAGKIGLPKILDRKINIAGKFYKMGVGGLHSEEHAQIVHTENTGYKLFEKDVASYYPNIIINQKLFPKHLGEEFMTVYGDVVSKRLYAKPRGKGKVPGLSEAEIKHYKQVDATLKIVINGSFGKFGNKWSIIYAPDFLMQVTITGQLGLLWLIELIENIDEAEVKSANTDGIVVYCSEEAYDEVNKACAFWEKENDLILEETPYKSLYSRDVNNYLGVQHDGSAKKKGLFVPPGLSKGAAGYISVTAVIDYLIHGIPLEDTIYLCGDITQFVHVRQVKGGGNWSIPNEFPKLTAGEKRQFLIDKGWTPVEFLKDGVTGKMWENTRKQEPYSPPVTTDKAYNHHKNDEEYMPKIIQYLGKTVRWYYADGTEEHSITYQGNGNTVATSLGAKPLMDLPDEFPSDIKYERYIQDSIDILESLGLKYEEF